MKRAAIVVAAASLLACGGTATPRPSSQPSPSPAPVPSPSPSPLPVKLGSVRMFTTRIGWTLLDIGADASRHAVARTTDGGAHWKVVLPQSAQVVAADFHDGLAAWALEMPGPKGRVVSTTNGGASWTPGPPLQIGGHPLSVRFADALHGWIYSAPSTEGALDMALYRTIDGGRHWQAIVTADEKQGFPKGTPSSLPAPCAGAGQLPPPSFLDANRGFIGGLLCGRIFLYRTSNGGLSWSQVYLPPFPLAPQSQGSPSYLADSIQFLGRYEVVLVLHRGTTNGANALQDAALYHSYDTGYSWSATWLPAPAVSTDFLDSRRGWMVAAGFGGDTQQLSVFQTQDYGRTWARVAGPNGSDTFGGHFHFVNPTTAFMSGVAAGLLVTTDAGRTWKPVSYSIS